MAGTYRFPRRCLRAYESRPDFARFLHRALIYRAIADRLVRFDEPIRPGDADPFLPAVSSSQFAPRPTYDRRSRPPGRIA